MSVRRAHTGGEEWSRDGGTAAHAGRRCRKQALSASPRQSGGLRADDKPLAVESALSAETPVSAAEVDAIMRLLADELDQIFGGKASS